MGTMSALEYLKQKGRMTNHCSDCGQCMLYDLCKVDTLNPEEIVKTVEAWAKEHPVKTYYDILIEKFPNATTEGICVWEIFGEKNAAQWNDEYKEMN